MRRSPEVILNAMNALSMMDSDNDLDDTEEDGESAFENGFLQQFESLNENLITNNKKSKLSEFTWTAKEADIAFDVVIQGKSI